MDKNQDEDEDMILVPQEIARNLINSNEEWRQLIISQINATNRVGRIHCFLPLGPSQRPNPYEGNRYFYAQWDPNVTKDQVREFLNDNESSKEEITWGRNSDEDEDQH